jgi:hypothetical protein
MKTFREVFFSNWDLSVLFIAVQELLFHKSKNWNEGLSSYEVQIPLPFVPQPASLVL